MLVIAVIFVIFVWALLEFLNKRARVAALKRNQPKPKPQKITKFHLLVLAFGILQVPASAGGIFLFKTTWNVGFIANWGLCLLIALIWAIGDDLERRKPKPIIPTPPAPEPAPYVHYEGMGQWWP